MKIGIFLTNQHPPGSDMIAALEGQYAMARLARDRGWDAVASGQHYLSEGMRQLQLVPFLARLAAEAGEMTGIAGVLLTTLHNPVEVAECIASLDAIWRGNFIFGVGLDDRAVRRAARLGDSWFVNPHATIPEIKRQLGLYRDELAKLGKSFPAVLPYAREIYCAKDTPTALEMAGPYLAEKYRTYATWGQDEVLPGNDSFRQPFEALLRDRFVLGSPEECYEQLRPCWEEAGANFLIFRTHWSGMPVGHALASMRLISDELLPELRRVAARSSVLT